MEERERRRRRRRRRGYHMQQRSQGQNASPSRVVVARAVTTQKPTRSPEPF